MNVREKIRNGAKPKVDSLKLGEDVIHVRAMSGVERSIYTGLVQEWKEKGGTPVEIVAALGICEEDGSLAYDYSKPADVAELKQMDAAFLTSVALKLFSISGLTEKAIEEAEKN